MSTATAERGHPAVRIVAEQEIRNRLATKSWRISALLMLAAVIGGCVLLHFVADRTTSYDVAVVGGAAQSAAEAAQSPAESADADLDVVEYDSAAAAESAVRDGDADVALLQDDDGWRLVGDESVDPTLGGLLSAAVSQQTVSANAADQGVDLERLTQGSQVTEDTLSPEDELAGPRRGAAFAMALMFYLVALLYGMVIAQSVVAEKESRVVEILAAAVPTRSLLWGKILGNSALALAQIVLLVAAALGTLAVVGERALLAGLGPALLWSVPFFALGFVALAAMWSAAGALASRNEDIASTSMPMQMLLVGAYLVAGIGSGVVLAVASFVPIASALVMPSRIAQGDTPVWEVLVSLGLDAVAAVALVRVGALIYDRNLMQTSRRRSLRESLRDPDESARRPG